MAQSAETSAAKPEYSFQKKVFFFLTPFVLFWLMVEVLFRLLGYGALRDTPRKLGPDGYWWVADRELGFRNRENGRYQYEVVEGMPVSTTDERGYRNGLGWDQRFAHPPEVALLGDSMVFGAELNDDQAVHSQLYTKLNGRAPVVNAAVRGYNTLQSKRILSRVLSHFDKLRVIVYVYTENDLAGNMVQLTAPAITPVLRFVAPGQPLAEVEAARQPVGWGESFAAVSQPSPRSGMEGTMRTVLNLSHSAALNQIVRRATVIVRGRTESIPAGSEYRPENARLALEQVMRQMKEICQRRHIAFLAARGTSNSYDGSMEPAFLASCAKAGVEGIPVASAFTGNSHEYMAAYLNYSDYDFHYGPRGAARFAEVLAPVIQSKLR
jgi:lysophospholipase L1-like esterase